MTMIPLTDTSRRPLRYPAMTTAIILINALVFLLELMGGIVLFILALTIFSPLRRMEEIGPAAGFLQPLFIAIGIFLLIKAAAGLAAGVGLIQRQPWARILAIVLAIIVLLNIPFGTALGVYTLWTLFSPDSQKEYEGMAGK